MSTLLPIATFTDIGGIKSKLGSAVVVDAGVASLSYDSYLKLDLTGSSGNASATGTDAVAIGSGAQATHDRSVAIGLGASTTEPDSVSVGSSSKLRKIKGVKDGTDPTDATTLGQVTTLLKGVSAAGTYLSGTITTPLTFSRKPLLTWVAPRNFTLTQDLIKANSVQTPQGSNLTLNIVYRKPDAGAQEVPIGMISYASSYNQWVVVLGVTESVVEGGMLWISDTGNGDTGFLSIGISVPAA